MQTMPVRNKILRRHDKTDWASQEEAQFSTKTSPQLLKSAGTKIVKSCFGCFSFLELI